jgi:hypothetical protein
MRGNLRTHHTSAEHGDFLHLKTGHLFRSLSIAYLVSLHV